LLKFPGLFNNGVWTYGEYLLKGEALYEVFILLVCLKLLYIAYVEYEKDVSKTIVCLNILPHKQCTTTLSKLII
jgi:hypothetical protein